MDKKQYTKELTELIDNWLFKTEHRGFHPTKYRPLCELLWENGYKKADNEIKERIIDLLIEFDEMSFCPTTTCPNPEEYAIGWKKRFVEVLKTLIDFEKEKQN